MHDQVFDLEILDCILFIKLLQSEGGFINHEVTILTLNSGPQGQQNPQSNILHSECQVMYPTTIANM